MSNGDIRPDIPDFPIPGGGGPPPRREFPDRNGGGVPPGTIVAGAAAVSLPRPPPGPTFPRGPAANDPIFRTGKFGIGTRLLGVGGLIIVAAEVLFEIARRKQISDLNEVLDEAERKLAEARALRKKTERIREAAARGRAAREGSSVIVPPIPGRIDLPPQPALPSERIPSPLPDIVTSPTPEVPVPLPGEIGAPELPVPQLPETPATPGTAPVPSPGPRPIPSPRPTPRSPPLPARIPSILPSFIPFPLTRFEPARVRSPELRTPSQIREEITGVIQLPTPQPVPQTDPARRCKPCKEDNPKPRNRCFKGLYREGPLDTEVDFTPWNEIDCLTGREL